MARLFTSAKISANQEDWHLAIQIIATLALFFLELFKFGLLTWVVIGFVFNLYNFIHLKRKLSEGKFYASGSMFSFKPFDVPLFVALIGAWSIFYFYFTRRAICSGTIH
jgi:hypothetical protein